VRFLVIAISLLTTAPAAAELRPGDVVFQTSRSEQGRVIREVTGSPWSHVGIVLERGDELWVLEAVSPVRWTRLEVWRRHGAGHRVLARRLDRELSARELAALTREGERLLGRPYDTRFEWGDERLYCSELVFLVFQRALEIELVTPQRWRELELGPRGRALARRRLGHLPPPDGIVVTPSALARSDTLVTVR